MIKHLGAALVAVCSLTVGMPASSASSVQADCRYLHWSSTPTDSGTRIGAEVRGWAATYNFYRLRLRCAVRLDGLVVAATPYTAESRAGQVVTTEGKVTYDLPEDYQTLQVCAQFDTGYAWDPSGEKCYGLSLASFVLELDPEDTVDEVVTDWTRRLGCDDGLDNDLDTLTDVQDPGCAGSSDTDERGTTTCDDGVDNDADGWIDYPTDTGCTGPTDSDE